MIWMRNSTKISKSLKRTHQKLKKKKKTITTTGKKTFHVLSSCEVSWTHLCSVLGPLWTRHAWSAYQSRVARGYLNWMSQGDDRTSVAEGWVVPVRTVKSELNATLLDTLSSPSSHHCPFAVESNTGNKLEKQDSSVKSTWTQKNTRHGTASIILFSLQIQSSSKRPRNF